MSCSVPPSRSISTSIGFTCAVGETVTLPHPPLPAAGVSIGMERGCHQNDSLADGWIRRPIQRLQPPAEGGVGRRAAEFDHRPQHLEGPQPEVSSAV